VLRNDLPIDASYKWVDFTGGEVAQSTLASGQTNQITSFPGHVFRFYSRSGVLLMEHTVSESPAAVVVSVCQSPEHPDLMVPKLYAEGRDTEFEALSHKGRECSGPSELWSCVKYTPKEKLSERDPELFGFSDRTESGHRAIGETVDTGYVKHIPQIRHVTSGPGFLVMDQTAAMQQLLKPWYAARVRDSVIVHPPIPGGYTNSHTVTMSKIDMDNFPAVRAQVIDEMQQVLQWWTNQSLKHTSTFGVRIYHRGSMLINHVDRADTHLASAVIQIAQEVDKDGGWPLEVLTDDGDAFEVFMQPGEMVLYEGARLRHGRPMRFQGTDFANVFSHFAPLDWAGPGRASTRIKKPSAPAQPRRPKVDL